MKLLAKSKDKKNQIDARTLSQHIDDCLLIAEFLETAFPKAGVVSGMGRKFWDILRLCVICHDLGKAHIEFQNLLAGKPNQWKSQRHELFSIPFVDALIGYDKKTIQLIKLAIAGHHKDFLTLQKQLAFYETNDDFGMLETLEETQSFSSAFQENVQVDDVLDLLKNYGVRIGSIHAKSIEGMIRHYIKSVLSINSPSYFSLMLLFGGLKWCDHLGSARVSSLFKLEDDDFRYLHNAHYKPYYHQQRCAQLIGNALLIAPTGSGKTESAFLWLQQQLKQTGQGRVFYVLPFTASINAMFERLKKEIGEEKVGMLHGKLSDYLNRYFDDLQHEVQTKKENIDSLKEKFKSIVSPVKVVTPFQLLKHLFGLKGYEQGIFEMVGSYLIFDEIHAYNPETFAQIKVLIEFATRRLNAKVMIMTATMPAFIRSELETSIQPFETVNADEALYNNFKRHRVVLKEGLLKDSLEEIVNKLKLGKKVLVVCNTVRSSQYVFKLLRVFVNKEEAILLHGAFTGKDRSKKEKALMATDIKLLVGTQAIEVSLDIDYDLIYTEPAPIDALIQRFGRVNRKREKGICDCFVFKEHQTEDEYIYNAITIEKTMAALSKIITANDGIIDEATLQDLIDDVYDNWEEKDKSKFNEQYSYLIQALEILSPLMRNKYTEEDFYKQFDGIKILPQCKREEFEQYLNRLDFNSAGGLLVQIRKARFISWLQHGFIKREIFAFNKTDKVGIEQYFITNKKYDDELGLIADEEEPWSDFNFI